LWAANDLKPHRTRPFKLSHEPQLEAKFWDLIGLHLDPPARAWVRCCAEKRPCQALERTPPGLPLGPGHLAPRTHDYYRHGTVTLFAALHDLNGNSLAERAPRHRHPAGLKFLPASEAAAPPEGAVPLILDNDATHKHPKGLRGLAPRPHFHPHFTPTRAAWLNLGERFFRDLSRAVGFPGRFTSVGELVTASGGCLTERNLKPQRYEWRAEGQASLEKIRRARAALAPQTSVAKDTSGSRH
jgi:hypothetical protein